MQMARDISVEMLKSFKENSILWLKRISIRFDKRCYKFFKTSNVLTPYQLTLSLRKNENISLPIIFGETETEN
jgi:hypothetical protein